MAHDYSENILVQESAGHLLHDELGWDVVFAYNQEVLGSNGTLGRSSYKEVVLTRYHGHAIDLAERIAGRFAGADDHIIMVVGGDGTLHETLNGLIKAGSSIPLAYIPAGSGNDFARGYGISPNPMTALSQILDAKHPTLINVGHYYDAIKQENGWFLNNLGIGFDAAIVSQANASKAKKRLNRWHLGNFSYLSQALSVLYNQEPFETMVQEKNGHHHPFPKTFILIASNHPYIGGGFKVAYVI